MAVIQSGDTSDLLSIDGNKAAKVSFGGTPQTAGFIKLLDSDGREIVTTENGALSTSIDQLLFVDQVDGSNVNTNKWIQSTSGMSIAQANGFITLNSGAATTANAYAILSSIKNIPLYGHLPVRISINAKVPVQPQSNLTRGIDQLRQYGRNRIAHHPDSCGLESGGQFIRRIARDRRWRRYLGTA